MSSDREADCSQTEDDDMTNLLSPGVKLYSEFGYED